MSAVGLLLSQLAVQRADADIGITARIVADPTHLFFRVGVGMLAVGASGLAGEGGCRSIPALFPEADVGAAFVVFSVCSTDTALFGVFH